MSNDPLKTTIGYELSRMAVGIIDHIHAGVNEIVGNELPSGALRELNDFFIDLKKEMQE